MIQFAIIALVVALSVAYIVHRVRKAAESADNPCCGCEGCPKKEGCDNREV